MPKERFHLYLADELPNRADFAPLFPASSPYFSIGAISPDIFFYDLPFFSLSPLGDALHGFIGRKGISAIFEWAAQNPPLPPLQKGRNLSQPEAARSGRALWAIGFACHFVTDAAWHPVIDELSRSRPWNGAGSREQGAEPAPAALLGGGSKKGADTGTLGHGEVVTRRRGDTGTRGQSAFSPRHSLSASPPRVIGSPPPRPAYSFCRSKIECHRLIESELEALWLPRSPAPEKYDRLLLEFRRDRGLLREVAGLYREFLEFAGLGAGLSEMRIVRCFLCQNFLLRLFANRTLGRMRDRLLSLPPTRFLGALVVPSRPVLPAIFSRALPEDLNPFSDHFMEKALSSMEDRLCAFWRRLASKP